jgi:hypothetical protein
MAARERGDDHAWEQRLARAAPMMLFDGGVLRVWFVFLLA